MNETDIRIRCRDCDDFGHKPDRSECGHSDVYAELAARGAARARAAIRPTASTSIGHPQKPAEPTGDLS